MCVGCLCVCVFLPCFSFCFSSPFSTGPDNHIVQDIPTGEHPPEMEPDSWPWLICPTRPAAVSIQVSQWWFVDTPVCGSK